MEVKKTGAGHVCPYPRAYVASVRLANFRGHKNVEAHLFRYGYPENELEEAAALDLVGPPDPDMPPELVAGASREAALKCVLEAFTEEECTQLEQYLKEKYSDQIEVLVIAPLNLPAPLGVGPLAEIPESARAGFIKFDKAPGYSLPFKVRAYYDLDPA